MTVGDDGTRSWSEDDPEMHLPPTRLQRPPDTGDASVEAALQRLHDRAESGSLDEQAEAGEAAHRALQERLADLGGD
ncbi:MAG: hypothetical protein ABJA74_06280 [Lapillicoccus sp.]